ncbi:hypothetical protein [Streptacidiphilus sp. MAP12-16]|uniref:hypothetical protein n=1 Tax=Streptacidiphilus sp. MAP12-16 TaxID=3156300 RepID=UPI0035172233
MAAPVAELAPVAEPEPAPVAAPEPVALVKAEAELAAAAAAEPEPAPVPAPVSVPAPAPGFGPPVMPVAAPPVPVPAAPQGGYYPPVPPPPPGYQQQWPATAGYPVAPPKPRSRTALYVSLAVVGLLVVIAGTATAVIALGGSVASQATPAVTPSTVSPSDTPTAAPTTDAPTPTPTVAPSPSSTVKGSVNGSSHSGDLRFFLLPVPADAEAYGDTDGQKLSVDDISKMMSNPSTSKGILNQFGCSGGATRTYRTNDGALTVRTELIHFDGPGHAGDWVSGLSFNKGNSFNVSGITNAQGQAYDPTTSDGIGSLVGVSHVGDVEYEIEVTGTGKLPHSLLTPLMQREEQRLSTGR